MSKYISSFIILSILLVGCSNTKNNSENSTSTVDQFQLHPSSYQADFVTFNSDSTSKLSVIFDKVLIYTSKTENITFRTNDFEMIVASGVDIIKLFAENEDAKLNVTIDIAKCKSGAKKTSIKYEEKKSERIINENNCGNYTGNHKLYDIWSITHLNNEAVDYSLFSKQPPFLEINLKDKRILGFGGCNEFSGNLRFDYNKLSVEGGLFASKKYCGDVSKIEDDFLNILRNDFVVYSFRKNELILETPEGSARFKKVD